MSIFEYNEELHIKNERAIAMEEGLQQGITQGLQQGITQGLQQGQQKKLVSLICKKMRKNKPVERIADELETAVSDIREIYDVACRYAPEYDAEKVFDEIWNSSKTKL